MSVLSWEADGNRLHAYTDAMSVCGQSQLSAPVGGEATKRDNRWKGVVYECDACIEMLMLDKLRKQIAHTAAQISTWDVDCDRWRMKDETLAAFAADEDEDEQADDFGNYREEW